MMKKLFFLLMAMIAFAACSSDPVFHGLTQQEKESFAQSIKGEYLGRYNIAYTDGQDRRLQHETVDSVTLSVSDLNTHTVIFNSFPLRLLAHVVDDPSLSQALGTLPDMGLTAQYEFGRATEDGKVSWSFDMNPIALSLNYGGAQHNIIVQFDSSSNFVELPVGQIAFASGMQLPLQLRAIYDGDRLLQQFDSDWLEESKELIAVFCLGGL